MSPMVSVLLLATFVALFGFALVSVSALLGPRLRQSPMKKRPYECGLEGEIKEDTKISVKFYLTAILFILFDIEIIFMYPGPLPMGISLLLEMDCIYLSRWQSFSQFSFLDSFGKLNLKLWIGNRHGSRHI